MIISIWLSFQHNKSWEDGQVVIPGAISVLTGVLKKSEGTGTVVFIN